MRVRTLSIVARWLPVVETKQIFKPIIMLYMTARIAVTTSAILLLETRFHFLYKSLWLISRGPLLVRFAVAAVYDGRNRLQ